MAPPRLMASQAIRRAAPFCKAEHAERAKEAQRGAEQPASPAAGRGGSQRAGEYRRDETEAHQPQSLRRDAEIHDFRGEPAGKRHRLARIRKARHGRGHAGGGAEPRAQND